MVAPVGHNGQASVMRGLGITPRLIERVVNAQPLDALDLNVDARKPDAVRSVASLAAVLGSPTDCIKAV